MGHDQEGVDLMLPTLSEIGEAGGPSHASLALGLGRLGAVLEAVDHLRAAEKKGHKSPTLDAARLTIGKAQAKVLRTNYAEGRRIDEAAQLFVRDAAGRARTIARAILAALPEDDEDPASQIARFVLGTGRAGLTGN